MSLRVTKLIGLMKVRIRCQGSNLQHRRAMIFCERSQQEHIRLDPKDGELCLSRVKPGETLVEARSDSNVQIDRQT